YKGHKYNDLEVLQGLAQIAAAAFAPFICGAAPQLFGLDDYQTLGSHLNFQAIFQQQEYIKWRAFRQQEDARFVALTLPRIILRKPHQSVAGELPFKERCERPQHYLWGNAAFAFASVIVREYGDIGWFAQIRGVPRDQLAGGVVTGYDALPIPDGTGVYHILTDVVITDAIERELSELGLMPLCQCYGVPLAAFHSNPSVHMPKKFESKSATANARISAMLQQVLCASRFAHYLKVMIRDKVGSYTTEKEIEGMLTKWLNQYTTGRDDLSWEMRAKYPLRDVRLQVREMPGMPGQYTCVIFLKPHYIAENLVSELKLTTELSQAGIGSRG
ncbi:MAG: type VI secretion system contractile sheath large subunit, partial [Ketobacter sp.]|nr:type VI secretion system contractile sheath large subunit [Ketobacter sp.]